MSNYYEIVIFTAALKDYADWVLNQLDPKGLIKYRLYRQHATPYEANYIKAKSLISLSEREGANSILAQLAKNPMSESGAEAAYLLISDAYDEGNFDKVEESVFALSDSRTPQAYWLAKSFIILGDSYAEKDELEQAKATFNSVLENYKPNKPDDIKDLVKMRLNKLK